MTAEIRAQASRDGERRHTPHGRSGGGRAACAAKRGCGSVTEPPLALLKRSNCPQEIDLAQSGPEDVRKVVLAKGALPEQESGEPNLTARADDQIGIRQIGRIEVLAQGFRRDKRDNLVQPLAFIALLGKERLNRIQYLLPAAIGG